MRLYRIRQKDVSIESREDVVQYPRDASEHVRQEQILVNRDPVASQLSKTK